MTTRIRCWLAGALVWAWLGGSVAVGQALMDREAEARRFNEQFLFRVWDSVEGLLPTYVRDVAQTPDGYVWLVSQEGLVRFDGVRAMTFSGRNVPGLPTPFRGLRARVDRAGRLWATTADGRLISRLNHEWRDWSAADGWPGFPADMIAETAAGMWFAGGTNLVRWAEGKFTAVPLPADAQRPLRLAAAPANQGPLWLSDQTRVWRREGELWTEVASPALLKAPVLGLAATRDNGVWVATANQVRRLVDGRVTRTLGRPDAFRGDAVEILEDSRGYVWVGAQQTGMRVWTPQGEALNPAGDTASLRPQITSCFEDREHNILVGTTGAGLARFRPKLFEVSLGDVGGLTGAVVNAICPGEDGVLIAGTEGSGLHRVLGNKSQVIVSTDGQITRRHRITAALKLRDGSVLVAVATKGLYSVSGFTATPVPTPPTAVNLVRVLFEDAAGTLWLAADKELYARPPGGQFAVVPGGNTSGVRAVTELPGGELWFASPAGLARRSAGQPIVATTLPALRDKANILALAGERDGTLWVAVENRGLLRVRDGQGVLFEARHGLPMLSFGAVLFQGTDVWLPGERGLLRVPRAAFDAVASGRATHLEYLHFNRGDGLPSDAFRRGAQHTAAVTSDGRLWFATHKGVAGLDPARVQRATFYPPPVIEEVRVERALTTTITPANAAGITIPPGTKHMTIRCSMPTLTKPEHVRFSYRLEGHEDYWHTADHERVIRFYDLPPGNYTFQVRALDADGRWASGATSTLGLVVLPFYWQTAWFRVGSGVALVLLSGVLVWRLQQQRIAARDARLRETEARAKLEIELQQARQVEAIGRLAGGIAHDFNNLLTVISGNAELALLDNQHDPELKALITDQLGAARRARDLVVQILTYSRQTPNHRVVHDLAPDLQSAVKLLRAGIPATTALDLNLPATLPPVLADAAQIQRVVTNLGTNAAQAVGASGGRIAISAAELHVSAEERPANLPLDLKPGRWVHLSVEDNGHGMDDRTLKRIFEPFFTTKDVGQGTGLGLAVVQGIVAAHDGHITVTSRPAAGTRFDVYFPVTAGQPAAAPLVIEPPRAQHGERILLLDDEPVVLSSTKRMLEKLGYQVKTYHDPAAALAEFSQRPTDWQLVITDFAMPSMTGGDFARQVWAVRSDTRIILSTGFGGSIGPDVAQEMGFARLLNKPFTYDELAAAVAATLRK